MSWVPRLFDAMRRPKCWLQYETEGTLRACRANVRALAGRYRSDGFQFIALRSFDDDGERVVVIMCRYVGPVWPGLPDGADTPKELPITKRTVGVSSARRDEMMTVLREKPEWSVRDLHTRLGWKSIRRVAHALRDDGLIVISEDGRSVRITEGDDDAEENQPVDA